ncbi:MAG: HDOD domain-containing protein [Granulosicoccus sp.]|nr:HDOD domain-containing protein [Granulosicoccus sp.]
MNSFYIARQPILDVQGHTYGYELLFRSSDSNAYDPSVDGNTATSHVLFNAIVEAGLDTLVGKGLAFINLTNRFFEKPELLELLPAGRCVLEVLETVDVNEEVVRGVEELRNAGHLIALDDFVDEERFARLLPMADIIKYDITQHSMDELARYRDIDSAAGRQSLAERVETHEEHDALKGFGFNYFQGYFFAKPKILSGTKLPQNRIALVQLLAEINNPNTTIDEVADIVGRDVSLGVRTLRYVNSPMNGLRTSVQSIKHATVLLGRSLIRNWVTLLVMSQMDDNPSELIKLALTRARFCQLLALDEGLDDARYFTIGLLSLLDVFMNSTMAEALENITISEDMRLELLDREGDGGRFLNWAEGLEHDTVQQIPETAIGDAGRRFQEASSWAEEISGLLD